MGREAEVYREGSGLPTPHGNNWGTGPLPHGPLGTTQHEAESRELLKPHLVKAVRVYCTM